MDTVSSITSVVGPALKNPLFKVGCFAVALISVILLVYFFLHSRKETREALKDKEIVSESHPGTTAIAIIFVFSLSFGILASMMDWNRPGKITLLDNGRVISDSKLYFPLGAGTAAVYDQTQVINPAAVSPEQSEPVTLKFKDFGSAQTDYKVKLNLPPEPEKIKEIHENYGDQKKLVSQGVKPLIDDALKIGAILLNAQEPSAEKEKKLYAYVKDQLEKGLYVVEAGKIKTDEKGTIIRKVNPLSLLKIKLTGFKLENFHHEELLKQLDKERDKLIIELKKFDKLDFKNLPILDGIQQEVEKEILKSEKLSQHQKELIINSVDHIKQLIQNLKEKKQKEEQKKPE